MATFVDVLEIFSEDYTDLRQRSCTFQALLMFSFVSPACRPCLAWSMTVVTKFPATMKCGTHPSLGSLKFSRGLLASPPLLPARSPGPGLLLRPDAQSVWTAAMSQPWRAARGLKACRRALRPCSPACRRNTDRALRSTARRRTREGSAQRAPGPCTRPRVQCATRTVFGRSRTKFAAKLLSIIRRALFFLYCLPCGSILYQVQSKVLSMQ